MDDNLNTNAENNLSVELMVMSGPDDGQVIRLDKPKHGDAYILGRREENDVMFPYDSQISRQHVRLFRMGGAWFIQDLGSRNGTYVGRQKIDHIMRVEPGQMFRLGRTWLRLQPSPLAQPLHATHELPEQHED